MLLLPLAATLVLAPGFARKVEQDSSVAASYAPFGIDEAGMDRSMRPGDDFYGYANGSWEKATAIPADRPSFGIYSQLNLLSAARVHAILDQARAKPESRIGSLYASFMDEAQIERSGVAPLRPLLAAITNSSDHEHLAVVMGRLMRIGVPGLVDMGVDADAKHPDRTILSLDQGGLGLPDRDYYRQEDADAAAIRAAYLDYLTHLFALAGIDDAGQHAAGVLAFETRLADAHWTETQTRDQTKTYNPTTMADLLAAAPGLDWTGLMATLQYGDQRTVILDEPSAIAGEARLFGITPLNTLKDYLTVRLLDRFAPYLSRAFVQAQFDLRGKTLGGTAVFADRWKRGADLVSGEMDDALSQRYVARYFPPGSKQAVLALVSNIKDAFGARLKEERWMTAPAKAQALAKLAAVRIDIGYPDKWRDYDGLQIRADDLVGNIERAEAWRHEQDVRDLHRPTDRMRWALSPTNANALSDPTLLRVEFPAALLQPPFFDPAADPAVNYGAIGETIAHELSHQFDDQGRKHDAQGVLRDWWEPQDVARFDASAVRLVAQYNRYEPVPGLHVNGRLTLGENIADLGGLSVAFPPGSITSVARGWAGAAYRTRCV